MITGAPRLQPARTGPEIALGDVRRSVPNHLHLARFEQGLCQLRPGKRLTRKEPSDKETFILGANIDLAAFDSFRPSLR